MANSKSLHSQSRGRKTDKNSDSKADIQKPKASRKHRARSPDEQPLRRKQRSVLPLKTTDPEKRLIIKELDAVEQLQERERKSRHRRKSHSENNKKDVSSEDETDVEKEEVFAVGQSSFPEYDEILGLFGNYVFSLIIYLHTVRLRIIFTYIYILSIISVLSITIELILLNRPDFPLVT